jgi:hypothetical protein
MVSDFINPTIFWEYDVATLNADEWPNFIIKQVFNRNVGSQPAAIPALMAYYGPNRVETILRQEEWLTSEGIQTARSFYPHLRNADFKASRRIARRRRQLAKAGESNPKL